MCHSAISIGHGICQSNLVSIISSTAMLVVYSTGNYMFQPQDEDLIICKYLQQYISSQSLFAPNLKYFKIFQMQF